MKDSQPIWPPRTFERIFTVLLLLIGLFAIFSGGNLILIVSFIAVLVALVCLAIAILWFAGKMVWDMFSGK